MSKKKRINVLYHATLHHNLEEIMENGLKVGWDGLIYFCTKPEDAVKFVGLRAIFEPAPIEVVAVHVDCLNKALIQEGFDHSTKFFGDVDVRTYPENIDPSYVLHHSTYEIRGNESD